MRAVLIGIALIWGNVAQAGSVPWPLAPAGTPFDVLMADVKADVRSGKMGVCCKTPRLVIVRYMAEAGPGLILAAAELDAIAASITQDAATR